MSLTPNGMMSPYEYWNIIKFRLEEERGWTKMNAKGTSTLKDYDGYMGRMANACPEVIRDTPIAEVTHRQLMKVFECTRNASPRGPLSDSSMLKFASVLNDLFSYAESRCDAINPLNRYAYRGSSRGSKGNQALKLMYSTILNPTIPKEKRKTLVIEELEKRVNQRRSLTLGELRLLVRAICTHLDADGCAIGLALALWLGVRPSECLSLRWADIRPYPGRPGFYIEIRRKLDAHGRPVRSLKSENGYRRIPIHAELQILLDQWREVIREKTGKEPEGYICCYGQQFGTPCTYTQFALFAKEQIFPRLGDDVLVNCALQMALDDLQKTGVTEDNDTLTLYVLRRNFWSMLQAGSQLNLAERRYVMGHSLDDIDRNLRRKYNDIDRLWSIAQEMNRLSFSPGLQEVTGVQRALCLEHTDELLASSDVGVQTVTIPAEVLAGETTLRFTVTTEEPGDDLIITLDTPLRGAFTGSMDYKIVSLPEPVNEYGTLNMEYDLRRAAEQAKRKTQPQENRVEDSNSE